MFVFIFPQASGEIMNADDCNGRSFAQGKFIYKGIILTRVCIVSIH